ncbi:MAG: ATP-binding cassette domain-containing protein [Asticcacaulis sp.]|nr:ATP-binding cassette domain-containing protein [Asticcacaulis sp.]
MSFETFYKTAVRPFRPRLWLTTAMAAGVGVCAVALLGLSGWFLTAAAVAGAAGAIAAQAFNYVLPSAFIRLFAIARTGLRYGERYLGHSAALRAMAVVRPDLFMKLVAARPADSLRLSRGEASSRFVQDVTVLENDLVMQSAPYAATGGLVMATIFCAWATPLAALTFLLFVGAGYGAVRWIYTRHTSGGEEQAALGQLKARVADIMAVLPDVRAYDLKDRLLAELDALEEALHTAKTQTISAEAMAGAAVTALTGLCLAAVAAVSMHGGLADMALALLAASMGMESLGTLLKALGQRAVATAARARVAALYDLPECVETEHANHFVHGGRVFALDGHLRVRIDGASGSGKTRFIETLMGLRGDAVDTTHFALCPQDAPVLTGTVRQNLAMAGGVGEGRMWQALDDAALKSRIDALPRGLDTWLGDGGITLSGGERRRLSLARAYLRDAPVLVLDEPTEALDAKTEAYVVDRLRDRLARTNQGLILISHRAAPRVLTDTVIGI